MRRETVVPTLTLSALIFALPLTGALLAGRSVAEFTTFPPPLDVPENYVRFSPLAASAVAAVVIALAWSWLAGRRRRRASRVSQPRSDAAAPRGKFPAWGWMALIWTGAWWALAWTRLPWFKPLQHYTFFPLWLGFIISANAAIQRRTGSCLMRRAPARWLALFGASAACWWTFEWLNRLVRNWHYLNAENFGPLAYFAHATVCFSTVLPAVAAVAEGLGTGPGWRAHASHGPAWPWLTRRSTALALLVGGCAALVATGACPNWFYPALWVSPLALALAAPVVKRGSGLARELAAGDWQRAGTWMIAAVICGFFWELWNWRSVAKWIYTVPGVDRWHLFEMPALGYAGYLPFGLECLLVAELLIGPRWRAVGAGGRSVTPASPGRSSRAHP